MDIEKAAGKILIFSNFQQGENKNDISAGMDIFFSRVEKIGKKVAGWKTAKSSRVVGQGILYNGLRIKTTLLKKLDNSNIMPTFFFIIIFFIKITEAQI